MKTRGKSAGIRSETTTSESAEATLRTCVSQLTALSPGIGEELSGAKRKRFLNSVTDAIDTLVSVRETLGGPLPVSFSPAPHQESLHQHWLLSRLIDSTFDAIIVSGIDSRILLFNKGASSLFGYPIDKAIGQSLDFLIPKGSRRNHRKQLALFAKKGKTNRTNRMLGTVGALHANGTEFQVEISISKFETDGQLLLLAIVRDVSEREESRRRLMDSREELRRFAGHLELIREEERTRIAREIHDALAQMLTRLKIDLAWLGTRLSGKIPVVEKDALIERVTGMNQLTDETIRTVQKIATDLRPAILDSMGLTAALEWVVNDFGRRTELCCEAHLPEEDPVVPPNVATALFRIAQECLTNIARHAFANRVDLEFSVEGDYFILTIRDDGIGIGIASIEDPTSLGLVGLRERTMLLNGNLQISGTPGVGSAVSVRVPITP